MGPANALSQKDKVDTSDDNQEVILLKEEDQDHHIQALDTALTTKISVSSTLDPIVGKALATMNNKAGEPWLPRTNKEDWIYEHEHLYFKNRLYIPKLACHDLVKSLHESPAGGHEGFFCTLYWMQKDYWWPGMSTFLQKFIAGCANCQAAKVNTHPTIPRLSPLAIKSPHPFSSILVDLIMGLPDSMDLTQSWLW